MPDPSAIAERVLDILRARPRVPTATYRVQMHKGFTFRDAAGRIEYLHDLGVDWLYCSPYLRARPDSTHGYDVSNHNQLNPAIGDEADYAQLAGELRRHGMGQLLDVVPNHMGIGEPSNTWWMDVLENGPSSMHADYFDIDWRPVGAEVRDQVLLPILGDQYGRVLENGELRLTFADGAFWVRYWETSLPVAPRSYAPVLQEALDRVARPGTGVTGDGLIELQSILTAVRNLPSERERDPARRAEHQREAGVVKRRLASLIAADRAVATAVDEAVAALNGTAGDARSFDRLDELIGHQAYRLAYWRVASEEINYRRFFDVNDLAAIRMENPEVFTATHRLILRLLVEGSVTGLRLDHPDGLWDPAGYFERLQAAFAVRLGRQEAGLDPEAEAPEVDAAVRRRLREAGQSKPLYVVAEKILAPNESLPPGWAIDGTVGYDYLNVVNGLFVDPRNRRRLDRIYERLTGEAIDFPSLVYQSKKLIMSVALASEMNTLSFHLRRIATANRRYRDFTLYELRHVIREVVACFPVYRTYVAEDDRRVARNDRAYVEQAVADARRRNPATDGSYFEFLRDLLLLRLDRDVDAATRAAQRRFVLKFQQVTSPVSAKGMEDTAFYVFNRLVSLNEVGGEPDRFGIPVAEFHAFNAAWQRDWPNTLNASSTHDTKRSEDVRARIDVLSELPAEWAAAVSRWERINRRARRRVGGRPAPDRNEEYLLYQTLVGAWPLERLDDAARPAFVERIVAYMAKATREAKVNSSWINPNAAWDAAVASFVAATIGNDAFIEAFLPLQRRVAHHGMYNSLAQLVLKLASPGVPDVYQGQELWDFSLVDPDNRRPVDYARRTRLLSALRRVDVARDGPKLAGDLLNGWTDGRVKLWVTHRGLCLRRARRALFADGDYRPLAAEGALRTNLVAFARTLGDQAAIVVVPRLTTRLTDDPARPPLGAPVWGADALVLGDAVRPGRYRDAFTGVLHRLDGRAPLADLFALLPVCLLERVE